MRNVRILSAALLSIVLGVGYANAENGIQSPLSMLEDARLLQGEVQLIDVESSSIVVDDMLYQLPEILVMDGKRISKPVLLDRLKLGQKLYFRPDVDINGDRYVRRIWSSEPDR